MFSFFKRLVTPSKPPAPPAKRSSSKSRSTSSAATVVAGAIPAPEVVEGNDHTDWDLWEDSVNALDSQMQSLSPSAKIYAGKQPTPSQFEDIDVFSRVGKNRDI